MAFIAMFGSCSSRDHIIENNKLIKDRSEAVETRLSEIEKKVREPQLIEQNVIGNETTDKFYVIDGKNAYVEIDGKSAEEYFRIKLEEK